MDLKSIAKPSGLRLGPIGPHAIHLCVDMQRLFSDDTPWKTPWMDRVLPRVVDIASKRPSDTIFTRFIPADRPGDGRGMWKSYWKHWASITRQEMGEEMIQLIPDLAVLAPPAEIIDKRVYSPWLTPQLDTVLTGRHCNTLIVTGGETDVCVLATVLGAIDRGYRVIVVTDALCSSADETHDAVLTVYASRFGQQVETVETELILDAWD